MATVLGNPYVIKDCLVTLGANDYSALVSQVELVPTTPSTSVKSVNGISYNMSGKASWVLSLAFMQDYDLATSLANYLFDNEGTTVAFTIKPTGSAGKGFQGNVVLAVGNIGGTSDAIASSSVTLQVVGKPARIV